LLNRGNAFLNIIDTFAQVHIIGMGPVISGKQQSLCFRLLNQAGQEKARADSRICGLDFFLEVS